MEAKNTKQKKNTFTIKDMTYISICTALMAICTWISIPSAVPFTLQTMGIFLTLMILGGKRGTATILVYI